MFEFLLKHKTKKILESQKREKVFLNWNKIQKILIVFNSKDYEEADAFIEYLEKKGRHIKVYAYKDKSDNYDYSETPYSIVTQKILKDWSGESLRVLVNNLKSEQYDLALDLSLQRNLILEYLFANANALLKAGYKKSDLPFYDLSITSLPIQDEKSSKYVTELARQVIYYLTTMR